MPIAVLTSTPSAPISMHSAACEGTPSPASTITGTSACSTMISIAWRSLRPRPDPIGAASGMTVAQPAASSFFCRTGSGMTYGSTVKPFADELLGRPERLLAVRKEVPRVRDHLELDPVREAACTCETSDAHGLVCSLAAGGVRQQHDALREPVRDRLPHVVEVDSPDRDRHELAARRDDGVAHGLERRILARAGDQP